MRCSAVGCTSGYDSNKAKKHFFRVPKNAERAKLWQSACRRKDIVLNSSHAFCEDHFLKKDIIWKHIVHDKNGKVIFERPLKTIRLKDNAVPKLFPWVELIEEPEETKTEEVENNTENTSFPPIQEISSLCFKEIKINDKIYLPNNWGKYILTYKEKEIIAFKNGKVAFIDEEMRVISDKEIIITEDLKYIVHLMEKKFDIDKFGFSENSIRTIDELNDLLKKIDDCKFCEGCIRADESEYSTVGYRDINNILRHKTCPIVIKEGKNCLHCSNLYHALNKRKIRQSGNNLNKRIILKRPSPSTKNIFVNIRKEKNDANREKMRLLKAMKKVKSDLQNIKNKLSS